MPQSQILGLMAEGASPQEAMDRRVAEDPQRESRQLGVIGIDGRSAQHTGADNSFVVDPRALEWPSDPEPRSKEPPPAQP